MILEIIKYPNKVLRKIAEPVNEIGEKERELAKNMIETMKSLAGAGLAAPQVNESKRIITIETKKGPLAFFNPEIIKKSEEKSILEEGCLSLPGVVVKVERSNRVEVSGVDLDGEKIKITAIGFLAHAFQHEIDHLDGKLINDYLPLWKKVFTKVSKKD